MKGMDIFNVIVGVSSIISMIISLIALRKVNEVVKIINRTNTHTGDVNFSAKGKENYQTSGDMTINRDKK